MLKCIIAIGEHHWCVLQRPKDNAENTGMLEMLFEDEADQSWAFDESLTPGVYKADYWVSHDGEEAEFRNIQALWILPQSGSLKRSVSLDVQALQEALQEDEGLYLAYKANIAVAFKDAWIQFFKFSSAVISGLAENAARAFLVNFMGKVARHDKYPIRVVSCDEIELPQWALFYLKSDKIQSIRRFEVEAVSQASVAVIEARSFGEALEYYMATHGMTGCESLTYCETENSPTPGDDWASVYALMKDLTEEQLIELDQNYALARKKLVAESQVLLQSEKVTENQQEFPSDVVKSSLSEKASDRIELLLVCPECEGISNLVRWEDVVPEIPLGMTAERFEFYVTETYGHARCPLCRTVVSFSEITLS